MMMHNNNHTAISSQSKFNLIDDTENQNHYGIKP